MMTGGAIVSSIAAGLSFLLALQVALQFVKRHKPYQLLWSVALLLFALGTGCQFLAEWRGWSPPIYRLWYLSGAILAASWLGQGSVYLLASQRKAHLLMALLGVATLYAIYATFTAPVDLSAALASGSISGHGMPASVRVLTPFFNIYGTLALVGGAGLSVWRYFWNGGNPFRASGTALIATGSLVVASGGTLARLGVPRPLYVSEMLAVILIFTGFKLTGIRAQPAEFTSAELKVRRRRFVRTTVGIGAGTLLGAVILLPVLPWPMGIVTDMQHTYTDTLPAENKGAYLITDQGVMQLYSWHVQPDGFPDDAPMLNVASINEFAVVQKQFDSIDQYQLYDYDTGQRFSWSGSREHDLQLFLEIDQPLPPGRYMWRVATDSMFGGSTWHYFELSTQEAQESHQ